MSFHRKTTLNNLYLIRHGDAEMLAPSDIARNLTELGQNQIKSAAQFIPDQIDWLYVSPYIRTQQSAKIICECKNWPLSKIKVYKGITPESSVKDALSWLETLEGNGLIVTHNPFVSSLTCALSGQTHLSFNTANVAFLSAEIFSQNTCTLNWIK